MKTLLNFSNLLLVLLRISFASFAAPDSHNETKASGALGMKEVGYEVFCKFQLNGFDCGGNGLINRFYFDIKLNNCRQGSSGRNCLYNVNRFDTITSCHTVCEDLAEHPIEELLVPSVYCRLQPDFGWCNGYYPRYYFDVTQRECRGFSFSGCGGNLNRFSSYQLCNAVCMPNVAYNPEAKTNDHKHLYLRQSETNRTSKNILK